MKTGTKIGWALIALSVVLSIWVIVGGSSNADRQEGDFILSDDGTVAIEYTGSGGSVSVPDGVVTISDGIFKNNQNITSITMPETVTSIGADMCSGCTQLQSISLSSGISSIPANAFRECSGLVSISLPSVDSIGSNAFYGCSTLSSITIPASCTSISLPSAFAGCDNLGEISVSSGNPNYSSSDGCLYNGAKTRLILVPAGKSSVSIASSCTTIGSGSFSGASYVTSLTVPDSVTTIEEGAFSNSGIRTITIPASVTSIGGQSGWTPSTIYGYADSAAETYAKNNSIPFVVIGPQPDPPGPSPEPTPTPTPTPDPEPTPYDPAAGDVINPDGTITKADGTVVDANGNVIRAGTGATGTSHTKDATPGTADGLDPRYFLCIAVFLGGAGCIVYARHRKIKYLNKKK